MKAAREEAWEKQLQRLAGSAKINLVPLPATKSHRDKSLLAAAMKRTSSVSNAWLAQRLQMGQPASASQFARRFVLNPDGERAVRQLLSIVKT